MDDAWTKFKNGRAVAYTRRGEQGVGYVYTVKVESRDVAATWQSKEELSREQIEAHFADVVAEGR